MKKLVTFKEWQEMSESKDSRAKIGAVKLAAQDAVSYLKILNDLIDDGGDWALQLVKDQKKIKKTIKDLEIAVRNLK